MSDCTVSEGDLTIACLGELVDLAPNAGVVLAPSGGEDLALNGDGDVDESALVRAGAGAGDEDEGDLELVGTAGIERAGGGAASDTDAGRI
jgi:hypothetical protein